MKYQMRAGCVLLAILSVLFASGEPVWAWNAPGHMVTAQIAYGHLLPTTKAKCDALLAVPVFGAGNTNSDFVTSACWADDIKSQTSAFSNWHFVDYPVSVDGTSTNSFPAPVVNVVWAVNNCIAALQNPATSQSNQAVNLRFLIHFMGDMAQPLHCADGFYSPNTGGDGGGNGFTLSYSPNNLHSLWDQGVGYLPSFVGRPLSGSGLNTISNRAFDAEAAYPYSVGFTSPQNVTNWALEAWALAGSVAYSGISYGGTPNSTYLTNGLNTSKQRMAVAGQRMADLLNLIMRPPRTNVVVSSDNFGPGTLSDVVANSESGDTIIFTNTLAGQNILVISNQIILDRNLVIDGSSLSSPPLLNAYQGNRIFLVTNATVRLDSLIFTNGSAADDGGAILNQVGGALTVNRCTFASNYCGNAGGAICHNGTSLVVSNSTFFKNSCGYSGGAILNYSPMTVNQCTIVSNTGNYAGGIMVWAGNPAAQTVINQSTIVGNAGAYGGGIYAFQGSATLSNSVVAWNTDTGLTGHDNLGDNLPNFSIVQAGVNITNGNPLLAPLADNGGITRTMLPMPGSPAVNGCTNGASIFASDQRGMPRVSGTYADIGAVEFQIGSQVTSASDAGENSLRAAVAYSAPGSSISFSPGLSGQTILLTNGPMVLAQNLTLDASGLTNGLKLDGLGAARHFTVNSGVTNTLAGLTLVNGVGDASGGGAILNAGNLTVDRCTLATNRSGLGGAIANSGTLTVQQSTLTQNQATNNLIALWTFESAAPTASPGAGVWVTNIAAEFGAGTASAKHTGSAAYSTPAGNGSAKSLSVNTWAVGDFFQFVAATTGRTNITVVFDETSSTTGPRDFKLEYSTDGTTFTQFGGNFIVQSNAAPNPTWNSTVPSTIYSYSYDLSSITALNGAARAYFRVTDVSTTASGGATVAASGTCRMDNFAIMSGGGFAAGGAIYNTGTLLVNQSTLAANNAGLNGAGIRLGLSGSMVVSNSIVSGNSGLWATNVYGAFTGTNNVTSAAAVLSALGNYGGPTPTMVPLWGSPAIDGCTNGTAFASDQRGFARVVYGFADIGAVEYQADLIITSVIPTATNATVVFHLNSYGATVGLFINWGTTTNYGTNSLFLGSGVLAPADAYSIVNGLTPSTLYHFALSVTNASGTFFGGDVSATTLAPPPPVATTLAASGVTNSTGTLNGTVNPSFTPTSYWFEWGAGTSYGLFTATNSVAAGTLDVPVSFGLSGFTPGLTNHYRLVASNTNGVTYGEDVVFGSPAITLYGAANFTNECHFAFNDPGATNSAGFGVSVTGSVSTNTPGVYPLTYSGTNNLGGVGITTRSVLVQDTLPPVVTLIGSNAMTIAVNAQFSDPGATAFDACGGGVAVATNSGLNTAITGTYLIQYIAVDGSGNPATNTRSVTVRSPINLIVLNTNDSGVGSLRQAIADALAGDTILFTNTLAGQTILLTSGQIIITNILIIDGSSLASSIRIQNNSDRLFQINGGFTVVMSSLTLANGHTTSAGGAILNGGNLTLNRCTLAGNSASADGGGGAILSDPGSTLNLNQCTLTGNTAGAQPGGAISARSGSTVLINQSTLTGNGGIAAGGIYTLGTLKMTNSIVAGNSGSGNVFGSCEGPGNFTNGTPQLAALGNYGGPTQTMPPLPGSPVIDAGTDNFINYFATDQAGNPRLVGLHVDIGAIESTNAPGAPTVTTLSASGRTPTSATLNGLVAPNGALTTSWFEYGLTTAYGSRTATNFLSAGATNMSYALSGLSPATYHYRAVGSNGFGIVFGGDVTFGVTNVVVNTNDSGAGSLRQVVADAISGDAIQFAGALSGQTIRLTNGPVSISGKSVTIDASALPGGIAVSGNGGNRVFYCANGTNVLTRLTITRGFNGFSGAGVYSDSGSRLTLNQCVVSNNSVIPPNGTVSTVGGGIFNASGSILTLNQCVIAANTAQGTFNAGNSASGGGIYSQAGSVLTVNQCTISGNSTLPNFGGSFGGGIYSAGSAVVSGSTFNGNGASHQGYALGGTSSGGGVYNVGVMTLSQCTFTGNSVRAADNENGGGFYNGGTLTLNQSTIVGNAAEDTGDNNPNGGGLGTTGTLSITNSIIANNTPGDISGSYSGANNLIGANPQLGPLTYNGGVTLTMAPLAGSPAIDTGSDSLTNLFTIDQRGQPRVSGPHLDIGAVEYQQIVLATNSPLLAQPSVLGNGSFQFSFTSTPGASLTVWGTTNLDLPFNLWSNLGAAVESPAGTFTFTDPPSGGRAQRFYRVTSP